MTIIQLEYIVALDTYRSFVTAAEKCFVTQPSLSMQVHKLENELDVRIFDRSHTPIIPTRIGALIIEQARVVLQEHGRIPEIITSYKNEVKGLLRIGIIPTLAPYILPPLVSRFARHYPKVKLEIWEYTTEIIVDYLKKGQLDCGLFATPVNDKVLDEKPLFYESFVVYTSPTQGLYKKKVLSVKDLPATDIWILNEGHCMRNQVLNICSRKSHARASQNLEYNTGSVETLKRLVQCNSGWTILNELSIRDLTDDQLEMVRFFKQPEPVREISLVTHKNFIKQGLSDVLEKEIGKIIPEKMRVKDKKEVISIEKA